MAKPSAKSQPAPPDSAAEDQATAEPFAVDLAPGEAPPQGFVRGRTFVIGSALFVMVMLGINITSTFVGKGRDDRLAEARLAMQSNRVAHVVEPTVDGVVERWTAAERGDDKTADQIRLVTQELLITRRNMGDFGVGDQKDLKGREVIEERVDAITITRAEVTGGAEIRYATADAELQQALQQWASDQKN
jgi:hypothetical protein